MSTEVRNLEPKNIWNFFEDLNAVPRASKKEERVINFIKSFGEKLNFETIVDKTGNVIIKKPATKGFENRKTVVLQSHLDMVHQKNNDTNFDFETQGIESYIDGDWVTANGTTLGADNGMGVATIMSLLTSTDIEHPALEALFTIDEETGMTGAFGLETGLLDGEILLNLDTEDDDELSVGCAGGIDTNVKWNYTEVNTPKNTLGFTLNIKGLKGGHSGMDIHLGRANANLIANRILNEISLNHTVYLSSFDGGSLRNAIPREALLNIAIQDKDVHSVKELIQNLSVDIKKEHIKSDPLLIIELNETTLPKKVMLADDQFKIVNTLQSVFNGVYRMSPEIEGLVEASSSLARVLLQNGQFMSQSLQRSSVESSKMDVAYKVGNIFKLIGAEVDHSGSYPGWAPNADSPILSVMKDIYTNLFNEEPKVMACHAGLECGILGSRYPQLDMISFGPTIKNPHSPDEKVHIESVKKFWNYLEEVLKQIPVKK
jgi:dipeptidase D